jgi:ribonuclease Z
LIFEVKILGSSSATPTLNRNQSCQLVNINQHFLLLDCGEGAQIQLLKHKVKIHKINYIFISHLHGDHYLGLFGLISSMHLQGRSSELTIFGPPGLADIITLQLRYSETVLTYPVHFKEIRGEGARQILETDEYTVETIPMNHRIVCNGFLIREKKKRHRLKKEKLFKGLKISDIIRLKDGEDINDPVTGRLIKNEELTLPPKKSRSYAYCADTLYKTDIIPQILNVDLLYHESTFTKDMEERARKTHHCTATQAATIAKTAHAEKLIIGHFSTRYHNLTPLLDEAKTVFENTYLAIEGETFSISEELEPWTQLQQA